MAGSNKFTAALEEAEIGLEIIHEKLRIMQSDTAEFAETMALMMKAANKSTPKGATKSLQEQTNSISELNRRVNLYIGLQKDMEKQWKKNITTAERFESNMQSINTQREKALTLAAKEKAAEEKKARAYNKTNKAFQHMKGVYRDIRIRKEMGLELTEKEIKKMERLEIGIKKMDTAMKNTDAKMGIHTRNVGNYGGAFDSLGFSVAQLTRESPAFINSMQTGFMAISNNIPTFVDEITKLKKANAGLSADGKKSIPIWKSVGKAIFGWQSAISAGIVLLTLYGPKLVEMGKEWLITKGIIDDSIQSFDDLDEEVQNSIGRLRGLVSVVQSVNSSEGKRLRAIKDLNDEYPEFNTNILGEKDNTELVNRAIEDQIELLIKREKVKTLEQKIGKVASDLATKDASLQEVKKRLTADQIKLAEEYMAFLKEMGSVDANTQANLIKQKGYLSQLSGDMKMYGARLHLVNIEKEKLNGLLGEFNENSEEENIIMEGSVKYYQDLINNNNDLIESKKTLNDIDEIRRIQKENEEYQAKIDLINNVLKKKKQEIFYVKESIGWYEQQIAANGKLIKQATNQQMRDKLVEENELLQDQIDKIEGIGDAWKDLELIDDTKGLNAIDSFMNKFQAGFNDYFDEGNALIKLDDIIEEPDEEWDNYWNGFKPVMDDMGNQWGTLTKLLGKDTAQLEADFEEMYIAMGGDPKDRKALEKAFAAFMDAEEGKVVKLLGQISATVNAAADLGNAIIEQNVERLEQEKTAIEERYDMEMLKAQENFTSKEALQDKEIFLEKKKQEDLRKIQDQINKEKRKQAVIDKAAAVATIAINTAIGVSAAITRGAVFNSAEVILTLALGALQTATVLATPIPQYKFGTENHAGGDAILGDGGKHEAIITPDGNVYKSPNKDTLMSLPKGTVVKPDFDQYMKGANESQQRIFDASMLSGLVMEQLRHETDERVLNAILQGNEILRNKKLSSKYVAKKEDIGHQLWALRQTNW